MRRELKPLEAQVMVITGATSGVGLATARAAAARGARLVLAARNGPALEALAQELGRLVKVQTVVADVADPAQVEAVAARAEAAFGGFDTWVNDAGSAIFGRLEDTPVEDQRRLFDTNYWGVVNGSLAAAKRLKARKVGALINIGSVLSEQAVPVQGATSAAGHAVKGFTNALRMELMRDAPGVAVTLIKPAGLDTPYKDHARNYTGRPAASLPPVYDPALVAEAILHAAETRVREVTVGGAGRLLLGLAQIAPSLFEPLFAVLIPPLHRDRSGRRAEDGDNLFGPGRDLMERAGAYPFVRRTSLYAKAQMNPHAVAVALAGGAATALALLSLRDQLRLARARRIGREKERKRLMRKGNPRPR